MIWLPLTWRRRRNRRLSVSLTLLSIALSVALLAGVDYLRKETRNSFLNTISGTDLVVGARSSPVALLLYSVFHIGNATNNMSWQSYQYLAQHEWVDWTIPLSLGDSHRGFRVIGTNQNYFRYYRYSDRQHLAFAQGRSFAGLTEAVVGSEVAQQLGYQLGTSIVLAHGAGAVSFMEHADKPFVITGILQPTGTPVDRSVLISLEGLEYLHVGWQAGVPLRGLSSKQTVSPEQLQPKAITAVLVGLKNRVTVFRMQREVNTYRQEALLASIPGVALAELWQSLGHFETLLRLISACVVIAGLLGLLTNLLSTLNERRREMAILRAIGAHPWQIGLLFVLESGVLALLGSLLGLLLAAAVLLMVQPWVLSTYGLYLPPWVPSWSDAALVLVVLLLALFVSLLPGLLAWRRALQDGLTVRL